MQNLPAKKITIQILENDVEISYPKSGQFIDIAMLKAKLTDGSYSRLESQNSYDSILSKKLVDAFTFFNVMIEGLQSMLNIKSLYDLEVIESLDLIDAYENQVVPWLIEWTEVLNQKIDELELKNKNKKTNLI